MGFYLNPKFPLPHEGELTLLEKVSYCNSKRDWLEKNGVRLSQAPKWDEIQKDCCAVCCVENGMFQAAAICYKPREIEEFNDPTDSRPRAWYIIEKKLAIENSDIQMADFR